MLIINGRIHPMEGAPIEDGFVQIENGKITAIGSMKDAPQAQEVRGYAVITVNGRQYGDPIAMDRDKIITVKQEDGKINRVHITPDEVYMESSTCDNQDCVGEGNVTHDNYQTRILGSWIICLPNAVTVEMIPASGD